MTNFKNEQNLEYCIDDIVENSIFFSIYLNVVKYKENLDQ
jgi:hypothetical protein